MTNRTHLRAKMVSRLSSLLHSGPSATKSIACSALLRFGLHTSRYTGHQRLPFTYQKHPLPSVSVSARWFSSQTTDSRGRHDNAVREGFPGRPKAVIFDLGGVVVPSPFPVFTGFEKQHGLLPGSVVKTIKETGADGAFAKLERGELTVGQFSKPFSEEYRCITGTEVQPDIFTNLLESMRVGRQVTAHTVILEVIAKLKKHGIKIAVLTNNFRYDDGQTLLPKDKLNVNVVKSSIFRQTCIMHDHRTSHLIEDKFLPLVTL